MRSLLGIPAAYRWFGNVIGGVRGRTIFVSEYLRPRRGDKILDIGCGEASILEYLPEVDYVGFDSSRPYIAAATRRHGQKGRFLCREVTSDAIEESAAFDIVMAIGVLHHLTDVESTELCRLAHRALRNGGRFVTFDGCYVPGQSPVTRMLLWADRGKHVRTVEQYRALARKRFPVVKDAVRDDLLAIPYTHFIMECVKG